MEKSNSYNKWGSRKLWIAGCLQAINTGLLVFSFIDAGVYEQLTTVIFGGYFLANVSQKRLLK